MPATLTASYVTPAAWSEQMQQHVVDCLREGRDEKLPACSDHSDGQRVSEWLSNCDAKQEALIFRLVHLALNKDNQQALHEAAQELADYVGADFASAYEAHLL